MTHILIESARWLLFAQITAGTWFSISCMIVGYWAIFDARRRFL